MPVELRRGSSRFKEVAPGRATWHALSFGPYYDPERTRIGPMICHDEHLLRSGEGFAAHQHAGIDIVTYVVTGALHHRDSLGNDEVLPAGSLSWLRASSQVEHSEIAAAPQTRFVQVWLQQYDGTPAWTQIPVSPRPATPPTTESDAPPPTGPATRSDTGPNTALLTGPAARSDLGSAERNPELTLPGGELRIIHLEPGERAVLPGGELVHAFVAAGALQRHSLAEPLAAGDAIVLTEPAGHSPSATPSDTPSATPSGASSGLREVVAAVKTTVLVWTLAPSSPELSQ